MAGQDRDPGRRHRLPRAFWILFSAVLVNRMGTFVLPYLALYLTTARGFGTSGAAAVVAGWGAGAMVASLVGGRLADGWGRRPTMVLSFAGSAGCAAVLAFARDPAAVVAGTVGIGLSGEMFRPAVLAMVADLVGDDDRTRAYGLLYWATNVGFAAAMAAGGLVAEHGGFTTAFVVDAVTSLAAAALIAAGLKETRARARPGQPRAASVPWIPRDPVLFAFVALGFVFFWIYNQQALALPLGLHQRGLSFGRYGLVMAVSGATVVIFQTPVTRLAQRFSHRVALAWGVLLLGGGFGLFSFVHGTLTAVGTVLVWTLGEILYGVAAPAALAKMAPPDMRGRYQGLFSGASYAAWIVAPLLGGAFISLGGQNLVWLVCALAGGVAAGGHLLVPSAAGRRAAPARQEDAQGAVGPGVTS